MTQYPSVDLTPEGMRFMQNWQAKYPHTQPISHQFKHSLRALNAPT